jgi:nucleotide-binding universal stress UspA family protein
MFRNFRENGRGDMNAMAHLLVCVPDCAESMAVQKYARYMHDLLGGQISYLRMTTKDDMPPIEQTAIDCDLFIFGEPEQSCIERLFAGTLYGKAIAQASTSFLLARQPRWPIQNILLILRIEETDKAAVDWIGRLTQSSGAKVTILPILYSVPSMYAPASSEETALGELLSPNTQPGQQLRCLSQRLAQWQIEGTLRFRPGEPEWQIRWEVMEGNYDLIIISAEPYGRWQRLLMGELVASMLGWLNRPLLIARPTWTAQSTVRDKGHD